MLAGTTCDRDRDTSERIGEIEVPPDESSGRTRHESALLVSRKAARPIEGVNGWISRAGQEHCFVTTSVPGRLERGRHYPLTEAFAADLFINNDIFNDTVRRRRPGEVRDDVEIRRRNDNARFFEHEEVEVGAREDLFEDRPVGPVLEHGIIGLQLTVEPEDGREISVCCLPEDEQRYQGRSALWPPQKRLYS